MKNRIIIILSLILLIFSVNFISATELTNNSLEISSNYDLENNANIAIDSIDNSNKLNKISEDSQLSESEGAIEIWVGQNKTIDGGVGSQENPFSTLYLACDYANTQNTSQVTLNIYNGTYELSDVPLKFNTSNLIIKGIDFPTIKSSDSLHYQGFSLVSSSSNYTFSGIITNHCLFDGVANKGIFNNCSFINNGGSLNLPNSNNYELKFNNCLFETSSEDLLFKPASDAKNNVLNIIFKNCIFNLPKCNSLVLANQKSTIAMVDCWLGKNTFPTFIAPGRGYICNDKGKWVTNWKISVDGYAQFSVSENYLGNNQYEIMGKLTWDDENNNASMECFQPMNVLLSSSTGEIQSNAILTNGTFRSIYTSNSTEHSVIAILGYEIKELEFKFINLAVDAPGIFYGEDQNVTINFPEVITNNITINVNNKTYVVEVNNSNSTTYTIKDRLLEGNYTVTVSYLDEVNKGHGLNSTVLTVSKVNNYVFDVVPSSEVKVGENATIAITLPEDVEGNVTIKLGNDTKTLPANQTMVVNFNNLNATTYPVTVTYTGSDKYTGKEKSDSITVDKADSRVSVDNTVFTYGDVIVIPFTTTNASGVNVRVLNKDSVEVANTTSEGTEFTLDTLSAGEYILEVTTIVNDNYEEFTADDITLTINKAESDLTLNDSYEFSYGENAVINVVTENSTGDVIVSLEGFATSVSGNEITLSTLNVGKYTLTVTTNPDENHNNVTKTATITINKATPSINIVVEPVENITTKDNVTLTISLPSDATGEVTVKINGKKTDIKSANETITIDLNNQAGDYVVDVTYSGDKNYESDMATKDYAVSKAETSITVEQIDFEEGNASKIEVTVPDVESGIVLVDVAGKKFYGDIESGKATITLEGVSEGNYTANIKFFGDEKYNQATTTADVKVSEDKIITELKEQLEEANAKVDNLTGELANATDKIANLTVELNETQANVTKLSDDLADANAKVDNLTVELNETQANVTKLSDDLADANAKVDNLTGELANATDKVDELTVELNETQANVTKLSDDLADANAKVDNLTGELANATDKIADLTVELNETQANATKLSEDLAVANQKVNNLTTQLEAQSNVTIVVDGVEYLVDVVNGTATIKTNSTKPISKKDTVIVVDKTFTRVATDYNAGERGGMFYAILKDSDGNVLANKTVQIAVNGPIYNVTTDDQGRAGLQVNLANANTYTYALSFQGDDEYNAAPIASSKLTVTKKKTTISASNKVFKVKTKTKKISVTLKTVKNKYDKKTYLKSGKKVTLKVNGKTYTAKINKKGVAKFTIKITKKGKYTAKIKFAGDKTYKASSKTIKIRIK
jgi:peptidoglycan hydrolase CwlO-like protein